MILRSNRFNQFGEKLRVIQKCTANVLLSRVGVEQADWLLHDCLQRSEDSRKKLFSRLRFDQDEGGNDVDTGFVELHRICTAGRESNGCLLESLQWSLT